MGTDLYQIGNHNIKFKNRTFVDISTEIKQKLDNLIFPNEKFLRNFALNWANSEPRDVRQIRKIKTKQNWTYREEDEYYNFAEDKEIEFDGPFNLKLSFDENKILFFDPPFRYWQWFKIDKIYRNEWRKYMQIIVNLFGGDRVIYLADNAHPLEEFLYFEGTFNEIEFALKNRFGEPKQTFKEVLNNLKNSYYIDNFKDIDWSKSIIVDDSETKVDDTSDINLDIENLKNLNVLKKLDFDDTFLFHKQIDNIIYFYHLSVYKGLLCFHQGRVGISEKFNFILDKYAPFTFDRIENEIQKEGFGHHLYQKYIIRYLTNEYSINWIETIKSLETELLWKGIGIIGEQSFDHNNGIFEFHIYSVSKQLFLDLLFLLLYKNKPKGKLEIFELKDEISQIILSKQL